MSCVVVYEAVHMLLLLFVHACPSSTLMNNELEHAKDAICEWPVRLFFGDKVTLIATIHGTLRLPNKGTIGNRNAVLIRVTCTES